MSQLVEAELHLYGKSSCSLVSETGGGRERKGGQYMSRSRNRSRNRGRAVERGREGGYLTNFCSLITRFSSFPSPPLLLPTSSYCILPLVFSSLPPPTAYCLSSSPASLLLLLLPPRVISYSLTCVSSQASDALKEANGDIEAALALLSRS
eukprot:765841-Hanusia_phi.AAC.2